MKTTWIDGNRLIGEFVGGKYHDLGYEYSEGFRDIIVWGDHKPPPVIFQTKQSRSNRLFELRFHLDWNWLMPVVHKILEETPHNVQAFSGNDIFEIGLGSSIETIFKSVVEYIMWYNNNPDKRGGENL